MNSVTWPRPSLPARVKPTAEHALVINTAPVPFALAETVNRRLIRARVPGVRRDSKGIVTYVGLRRDDPLLIMLVLKLGARAAAPGVNLQVVRIPEDDLWLITRWVDGHETLKHWAPPR